MTSHEADAEKLKNVLTYHVVAGHMDSVAIYNALASTNCVSEEDIRPFVPKVQW